MMPSGGAVLVSMIRRFGERKSSCSAGALAADKEEILDMIKAEWAKSGLTESDKICPECGKKFFLIKVLGIELDTCLSCRSFWFDQGELKDLTGADKDVPGDDLIHRKSKYNCPVCSSSMREYTYTKGNNLLVDRCSDGHGVYLEGDEIRRVLSITK